jgi:hypothetical protein
MAAGRTGRRLRTRAGARGAVRASRVMIAMSEGEITAGSTGIACPQTGDSAVANLAERVSTSLTERGPLCDTVGGASPSDDEMASSRWPFHRALHD